MKLKSSLKINLIVFLIIFVITFFLIHYQVFNNINLKITDQLYGGSPQINNIVIIAIDDKSLQEIGRWPWDRSNFAEILEKLNESKVIGIDVGFYEEGNLESDLEFILALEKTTNVVLASQYISFEKNNNKIIGKEILLPINSLKNTTQVGYVNIALDRDGISRSMNFNVEGEYESFSKIIAQNYLEFKINNSDSEYLINYVGKPESFKYYSFSDVILNKINTNEFKEKIVLIGATSPDLRDTFLVPTSEGKMMPGVEIHANSINTLILDQELTRQSKNETFLLIFITIIISLILLNKINLFLSTFLLFTSIIIYLFFAIFFFSKGLILNIIYYPLTIFITYITFTASSYLGEQKAKREIQNAFGKYLSPVVIEELIENPSKLKLGGQNKNITVFFSDIAGFTTISEKLGATKLTALLNEYLDEMAKIVLKNNGLVDKFIGDAVMAFWGAPLSQENQSELAAITALEQQQKLKELRADWKKRFGVIIEIRIGLAYGEALVGNMGSQERFDYTCIGDIVNLSARLEGINKTYGTNIMVSELVYNRIKNKFVLREIDSVRVKGKKKPTKIYELIGTKKKIGNTKDELILKYNKAISLYKNQKFKEAHILFDTLSKKFKDNPSKLFSKRCLELKKEKLGENWDGVYDMKTK